MKRWLVWFIGFLAPWAAAHSIYGLELGQPLSLKECPKSGIAGSYSYSVAPVPCYRGSPVRAAPVQPQDAVMVAFPYGKIPAQSSTNMVGVFVIDDVLQLVVINTQGVATQDAVFDDLVGKYGKPSVSQRLAITTGYGKPAGGILASWDEGEPLQVNFFGVAGSYGTGLLLIGTKRGQEERAERMKKALASQKTPL